ncbi:MAG: tetratricopeptide repeat protein [SAR324 cluster bacterium]|nr:tetratricopeptide repeat protein [SAR324 cluster bacterium]
MFQKRFHFVENHYFKFLCLACITLIVYYPAIQAEFIWDDFHFFINDPLIGSADGLWKIWFDPGTDGWNYWPITRTAFWIQRQLWDLQPLGYHVVNIVFHFLNATVLWLALKRFQIKGAWLVGLLFAIHPVHVASTAWVTELKNTLSGFFYLLSIWSFIYFDHRKKWHWYFISLGLFACALLSKSTTIMLPVLLIASRLWFQREWQKKDILCLIPFFLLALGSAYVSIWFESQYIGTRTAGFSLNWIERIQVAGHVPFFYLDKLLFPYSLIAVYPKWKIMMTQLSLYLPILALGAGCAITLWRYQQWGRPVFLSVGAFIVTLFPVLGLLKISGFTITYVWIHHAYLPSVPIFILLGSWGMLLRDYFYQYSVTAVKMLPEGMGILFFCVLGMLTWNQVHIYKNEEILWKDAVKKTQSSWMAFQNMGIVYRQKNETEKALEYLNKALQIEAHRSSTYYHRGGVYVSLGQYEQAIEDYNKAISLTSDVADYYNDRGIAYHKLHQYEQAIEDYHRSIELDADNSSYYNNRANIYYKFKQYKEAIADYSYAIVLKKDYMEAYKNRATVYLDLKEYDKALQDLNYALSLDPKSSEAYNTIGAAYLGLQKYEQAIESFNEAFRLNPALAMAKKNLAIVHKKRGLHLAELGQYEQAFEDLTEAIRLQPDLAEAYDARGFIYRVILQNKELACQDWQKACELGNCNNFHLARQEKSCP